MEDLSSLGAATAGIWSRRQALRVMSAGEVDAAVRSRTWQTVWDGVYADAGFVLTAEQRAFAAVLASGGGDEACAEGQTHIGIRAYACGRTAARVWGFPLIDDDDPATGALDGVHEDVGVARHLPDVEREGRVLHRRQLRIGRGDVVRHRSGLWITSPARTLRDCARLLAPDALVCCLDDALHRELVDEAALTRAVMASAGGRAARAFREAVAAADGRAEAPSETLLRLLLLPHLPGLVPQVELFDDRVELVARFDLADEDALVAFEADGKRGHSGELMVARDRRRDRRSTSMGWATDRFTWFDLRRRRREVVQRAVELDAAQRRRRPA